MNASVCNPRQRIPDSGEHLLGSAQQVLAGFICARGFRRPHRVVLRYDSFNLECDADETHTDYRVIDTQFVVAITAMAFVSES
jgi:hypothetical protein